ncbi:MAG: hypothetical protein AB8B55_01840 [Mariniblastus sp.]
MVFQNEPTDGSPLDDSIRFIDETDGYREWGANRSWANQSKASRSSQLKQTVKHVVCLWWSDQIPSWIHPDDVEIADRLVPGGRIFRREECENFADRELGYSFMSYGEEGFRALPAICMEVRHEGFELNDFVEIKSGFGKRFRGIGTIHEISWNRNRRGIDYFLTINGQKVRRAFWANEIQPAIRLGSHLSTRELETASRTRWSI